MFWESWRPWKCKLLKIVNSWLYINIPINYKITEKKVSKSNTKSNFIRDEAHSYDKQFIL